MTKQFPLYLAYKVSQKKTYFYTYAIKSVILPVAHKSVSPWNSFSVFGK